MDVALEDNSTSEPEPDILVLRFDAAEIPGVRSDATDAILLLEIADTTLRFDLSVKADLYARAAIADYWVLDVNARRLIVHREPANGRYTSIIAYSGEERVAPLAAPEHEIAVADLFPRFDS